LVVNAYPQHVDARSRNRIEELVDDLTWKIARRRLDIRGSAERSSNTKSIDLL
jgi:hypothetical protein